MIIHNFSSGKASMYLMLIFPFIVFVYIQPS